MDESTLLHYLSEQGYKHLRRLDNDVLIGTMDMAFTTGLFYGLTVHTYEGRYCYEYHSPDVYEAVESWTGEGDPSGEWIKHKGQGIDRSRIPDPYE